MAVFDSRSPRGTPFTGASLIDMLRYRAELQPDDPAYTFLEDGEEPGRFWTWSEIDRRARAIATWLRDRVDRDERALLMFPPGLEFVAGFFGCLYARVIAVPVMPPQRGPSQRGLDRVQAIVGAAAPAAVLTAGERPSHVAEPQATLDMPWLDCSAIDLTIADRWIAPPVAPDDLAFLQFTSGSTASPRGVMVSHANLLHNLAYGFHAGDTDSDTVSVSWLPVTHDMGLIEGVLQPAFSGCPAYLMAPSSFLQRPVRWLKALSDYAGTRSGGPNFAYDLAASRVTAAERAQLDLSSWKAAYNGAEPVRADTLAGFAAAYASCGFQPSSFRPCYGLAENTLLVSSDRWDEASMHDGIVSCGVAAFGTHVVIADSISGAPCRDGELGEIQIAGPSVARGYWNDAEETRRVFVRMPGSEMRWLRTGDLGFSRDGRLYVSGRLKDLLIVRGAKHFPQDVERTVEQLHPAIRRGGVTAVAVSSGVRGDHVVVIAEADPRQVGEGAGGEDLIGRIREAVAEQHGIQVYGVALVPPGTIPKTTSGKPRRYLCREAWNQGTLRPIALWSSAAQQPAHAQR